MIAGRVLLVVSALGLALGRAAEPPLDVDMILGATAADGGALRVAHDFTTPVRVTRTFTADGIVRWSSTQPGFDGLADDDPARGLFPLRDGIPVRVEVTAIDPEVSFKLGSTTLAAPGDSAPLGTSPNLHVHGEWRLLLPEGVVGAYHLAFRLTTEAHGYGDSPAYDFTITNAADGGTVTTTTLPARSGVPLAGRRLVLRAGARGGAMALHAAGPSLDDGADPTRGGAALRVVVDGRAMAYSLPATGWRTLGRPAAPRGYRYRSPAGPVRGLVVRDGALLAITGRDVVPADALGSAPAEVAVVLRLGDRRWCLRFVDFHGRRRLRSTDAPPPVVCPTEEDA